MRATTLAKNPHIEIGAIFKDGQIFSSVDAIGEKREAVYYPPGGRPHGQ